MDAQDVAREPEESSGKIAGQNLVRQLLLFIEITVYSS